MKQDGINVQEKYKEQVQNHLRLINEYLTYKLENMGVNPYEAARNGDVTQTKHLDNEQQIKFWYKDQLLFVWEFPPSYI